MTLTLKDINFNIAMYGTEPVVQSTYSVVYTGDESSVKVNFNVTDETDLTGATAKVHLYFADSSHIEKDAQIDGTVVHYTLKGTENDHAGPVRVDVFITLNGATYTRAGYKFRIDQSLEASAPLVEYAIETLDTVIEGADEWLAQAQTDFGTAQNQRAAEWVSDNDTRDDQFNAAQAIRTESFGQSETARTAAFNTSETGRSNTFTTNENARQAAADANETARNNSYTVAENDREERYGIAESNRSATADADHTRAVGDHNTATDDHGIAESDHVTATADHENYAGLLEDGVLTTQIVDKLTELETTYSPRLLSVEQQLEQAKQSYNDILSPLLHSLPESALRTFSEAIKKGKANITFWGDSITASGDQVDTTKKYVDLYSNALVQSYPEVVFTFKNYGIGGSTVEQAASDTYLAWFPSKEDVWRNFIKDSEPDLLFVAFGMNGTSTFKANADSLNTIDTFTETFSKKPSLVLLTNFLPRQADTLTETSINIRLNCMRSTREWAINNGYGLIDVGRIYQMTVGGYDEINTLPKKTINFDSTLFNLVSGDNLKQTLIHNQYVESKNKYYSFKVKAKYTWSGTSPIISIKFRNDYSVFLRKNGQVQIWEGATQAYNNYIAGFTGDIHTIEVEVYGSKIKFSVDGVLLVTQTTYYNFSDAIVRVGFIDEATGATADVEQFEFTEYEPTQIRSTLTMDDVVGNFVSGDYTIKYPYGGNGLNHPTSKATSIFYKTGIEKLIESCDVQTTIKKRGRNILLNPNFTIGAITNWSAENVVLTKENQEGFAIAKIVYNGGSGKIFQSFNAIEYLALAQKYANKKMYLGAWMKCPPTNTGNFGVGINDGVSVINRELSKDNQWHFVQVEKTIQASPADLILEIGRSESTAVAGDVIYSTLPILSETPLDKQTFEPYPINVSKATVTSTTAGETNDRAYDATATYLCVQKDKWIKNLNGTF